MSEKVKMSLVQGTITLKINIDSLVPTDKASNDQYMHNWFLSQTSNYINLADEEIDYDNQVDVIISKGTAEKYSEKFINEEEWKMIRYESRDNGI